MSRRQTCLPPTGQRFHFKGTGGPMLLMGDVVQIGNPVKACPTTPCIGPRVPRGTVAFFAPRRIPPTPGPGPSPGPGPHPTPTPGPGPGPEPPPPVDDVTIDTEYVSALRNAELCGFNELASPSTPPKKYKNRDVSGSLTKVSFWDTNDCVLTYPPQGASSFSGPIPDSGFTFQSNISVAIVGESETQVTYQVFASASDNGGGIAWRINANGSAFFPNGGTFVINKGVTFNVQVEWNWIYWHGACSPTGGHCIWLTASSASFTDNWNIAEFYDSACNFYSSVSALRETAFSSVNLASLPGLSGFVAAGQPQFCYDPATSMIVGPLEPVYITTSAPTQTNRTTTGLGCVNSTNPPWGTASVSAVGTITEQLSSEDTEAMAIARATPIVGTSNVAKYEARAAFGFLYQTVDVGISIAGLTPGQDYLVSIPIITEDFGGGNSVNSNLTYGFSATATTKTFTYPVVSPRGKQVTIGAAIIAAVSVTPTLVSATLSLNGLVWTLVFTEAVQFGAGGSAGFVPTPSGGAVALNYTSGNGTATWTYTGSRAIQFGEVVTLAYTQPGNGIKDITGLELSSFSGQIVVNNSNVAGPPLLVSATLGTNGTTWTFVFSEIVQIGAGGSAGFVATPSGGSVSLTYASGSGTNALVYTGNRVVYDDEFIALAYTQPGSGVERPSGEDLASFSGTAATNNSSQLLTLDAETIVWRDGAIAAGGANCFEGNSITIANNFINALQAKSYNSGIVGFWPLLGKTVPAARMPLRDSLGVGIAGNANCVNADFSQATGLQGDGFSKILDLLIKPSQLGAANSGGMGYGEGNIAFDGNTTEAMGCNNDAATNRFTIDLRNDRKLMFWGNPANGCGILGIATNSRYYSQRPSSILRQFFVAGALVDSNTTADATAGANENTIRVLGSDDGANGILAFHGRCLYAFVTDGTLTAPQVADFDTLIQTHLLTPTGR